MQVLALDSAVARCSATLVSGDQVMASYQADMARGHAAVLSVMVQDLLRDASIEAAMLDLIAVTVGPGSFTGIRSGIAMALGIGMAANVPVIGVTVGEALAMSLPFLAGRKLWCAIPSRRDRVFLEIGEQILSCSVRELPEPREPVAIAGSAAMDVAARLAARGADVMLTDSRLPRGQHVAAVAVRRYRGEIRGLPTEPLYIDAPEAKPQAGLTPPGD